MTDFKSEKFTELILYFSGRGLKENLVIGSTKLNKLLFFADFRAYAKLGEPITGARYQRLEWGPAPRALLPVRGELIESGEARFRDSEDWSQVLEPLRDPDMSRFSEDERFIIDEIFEELRPFNATAASDYSHTNSPGWLAADEFEDIPYETARISTKRPPEQVFAFFRQLHGVAV
ncbi:MAG: Panacea domain-containing protein [Gaiellaceae bacterium]|jgi:uncharacterized phage-associated protein